MKLTAAVGSNFLAVLAAYLVIMAPCRAGGSIDWDHVRNEIAKDDPFLADYIAKNFEMSPSGGGLRVGHDKDGNSLVPGVEAGTRIPPYEFRAKPLGAAGDYTLNVTLDVGSFENGKATLWTLTLRKMLPSD